VYNCCYRILANRMNAEDLTQDTFLRAFQRLKLFDLQRPFAPWIKRIATNLCINYLKTQRQFDDDFDEELMGVIDDDSEMLIHITELRDKLQRILLTLPARYRLVLELRHFQEMSYAEIALELNLPVSDVKSYLFRGRKRLIESLRLDDEG
jgi:RNA polymerase sigma-70 factor, ECF subfamily